MQQVKDFNFIDQEFIPVVSKYYKIYNVRCGLDLNHAVLAVGYGHDNISKKDYYLIKNSWSIWWGN